MCHWHSGPANRWNCGRAREALAIYLSASRAGILPIDGPNFVGVKFAWPNGTALRCSPIYLRVSEGGFYPSAGDGFLAVAVSPAEPLQTVSPQALLLIYLRLSEAGFLPTGVLSRIEAERRDRWPLFNAHLSISENDQRIGH